MTAIYLIEKTGTATGLKPLDFQAGAWASGYWKIAEDTALKLIGASLYLHTSWASESHFGGKITSYVVHHAPGTPEDGRIVFRFTAQTDHKAVKAPSSGASGEKRIVW